MLPLSSIVHFLFALYVDKKLEEVTDYYGLKRSNFEKVDNEQDES